MQGKEGYCVFLWLPTFWMTTNYDGNDNDNHKTNHKTIDIFFSPTNQSIN